MNDAGHCVLCQGRPGPPGPALISPCTCIRQRVHPECFRADILERGRPTRTRCRTCHALYTTKLTWSRANATRGHDEWVAHTRHAGDKLAAIIALFVVVFYYCIVVGCLVHCYTACAWAVAGVATLVPTWIAAYDLLANHPAWVADNKIVATVQTLLLALVSMLGILGAYLLMWVGEVVVRPAAAALYWGFSHMYVASHAIAADVGAPPLAMYMGLAGWRRVYVTWGLAY